MAFTISNNQNGENFNVTMVLPANVAETFDTGEALVFTSGVITKAGAAVKPTFLAARIGTAKNVPSPFGVANQTDTVGLFPVNLVVDSQLYQSFMAAGQAKPNIGDKLTISSDGLYLMAAVGGPFEVYEVETLKNGEIRVIGRFIDVAAA